jgi:aryl-alcohol dehydrogenase-like predicted oxidoreductase
MLYRVLGRSGMKVSPLCLGTMNFGDRTDETESAGIIAAARDIGVNFIDTADVYVRGRSEEIVGRAIRADRAHWVLATKVYQPMGDDPNQRGLSRRWITAEVEASLKRLGTDYIDLYYFHREDLETRFEDTLRTVGDLIRAGKIRSFGLSNYRGWRVAEFAHLCDRLGIDRPAASQPYYNAFNRMPEVEHLPACDYYGLGVVPYSPIARGVLSGKYAPDAPPPPDTRVAIKDKRMMETEFRPESLRLAQQVKTHAEARGMTTAQFAVNWVLNNKIVTSAIVGPRTMAQWQEYAGALDKTFTAEDEALIDSLVAPGHPSTPGYNDPGYRIEGRISRVGAS